MPGRRRHPFLQLRLTPDRDAKSVWQWQLFLRPSSGSIMIRFAEDGDKNREPEAAAQPCFLCALSERWDLGSDSEKNPSESNSAGPTMAEERTRGRNGPKARTGPAPSSSSSADIVIKEAIDRTVGKELRSGVQRRRRRRL